MNTETQTSNTQNKNSRDLERGALWLKKSKAGADFLSGYVIDENKNKINVVVFKNNYKKPGESSPDYRIYLSESPGAQQTRQETPVSTKEVDTDGGQDSSDDIPF
jgi:uncharacterized protein (DUF736 family)